MYWNTNFKSTQHKEHTKIVAPAHVMLSPFKAYGPICSHTDILVRFWKISEPIPKKNSPINKISYQSKHTIDEVKSVTQVNRVADVKISNFQLKEGKIKIFN